MCGVKRAILALGVIAEVDKEAIEDASWLRKDDNNHINVAEFEAVIKGISVATKWKLTDLTVFTHSATVYGWVQSIISDSKRLKVGGMGEMLIRRRLGMIAKLIEAYKLQVCIQLVESEHNPADKLTRVPKNGLVTTNINTCGAIRDLHDTHHPGVNKTFHLARIKMGKGFYCRRCF